MSTKIVFLNGPPGSGKDTAASALLGDDELQLTYNMFMERSSMPLKRGICGMFGERADEFGNSAFEVNKDLPNGALYGRTYRSVQIKLFEWMAKTFEPGVLGTLLARRIIRRTALSDYENPLVIIPDIGTKEELDAVLEYYSPESIIIVRLSRSGCSFLGDCRSYVDPGPIHRVVTIANDTTIDAFSTRVVGTVKGFLDATTE